MLYSNMNELDGFLDSDRILPPYQYVPLGKHKTEQNSGDEEKNITIRFVILFSS
jgi:hypothetical protein